MILEDPGYIFFIGEWDETEYFEGSETAKI